MSGSQEDFSPDVVYNGFENAHNLAINEATGFACAVATDTCGEGLHMMNLGTYAIDRNLYVQCNRVFQANYTSGLRVLEFGDLATEDIREIAFFDTSPGRDDRSFQGAWGVYPYLPSGTLIVSDIGNGLFVLSLE